MKPVVYFCTPLYLRHSVDHKLFFSQRLASTQTEIHQVSYSHQLVNETQLEQQIQDLSKMFGYRVLSRLTNITYHFLKNIPGIAAKFRQAFFIHFRLSQAHLRLVDKLNS